MLQLRPICENCAKLLPPDSDEARICSFECTFCRSCVEGVLCNVCPNCGGGFVPRPIRPATDWSRGNSLDNYPPSEARIYKPIELATHRALVRRLHLIPPSRR